MAGCYHDKQVFKSDIDIEVARECDILEVGQDIKDRECKKNPGHRGFIPFKDLTLEHLPIEHRNTDMLNMIKKNGKLVVRLVVEKKKNGKRVKEYGSGYVFKLDNEYFIKTNNHVVGTEDEVKRCTVEFHYHDESKSGVFTSRGVELGCTCPYRDITLFTFHPVPVFLHQLDLTPKSSSIVIMYNNTQVVTADLLHTCRPMTMYSELDMNSPLINFMFITTPDSSISYIKSCYIKFQPIPSNRPLFTSISSIKIEIHMDENDGNSRVIPGDMVKFGDEFVVKISESIFQDEVKKCRLVWNGGVIGRGTRLFFKQLKSSDMFSGIDKELDIEQGRECHWIFEFHPIPKFISEDMPLTEQSSIMCCIGHPHGGIKMVTLGQYLEISKERFDNLFRHIASPSPDCQCKEVGNIRYSCKTCVGSSGSPVFALDQWGADWFSSLCHFMGQRVELYTNTGEMIENVNSAWLHLPLPPIDT